MTRKPAAARIEREARTDPVDERRLAGDPLEILEETLGATEGDAVVALAALKDRVAWLTDERDGLLELNAALERENDELNVALLRLAIGKQAEWEAAPSAEPAPPAHPVHDPEPVATGDMAPEIAPESLGVEDEPEPPSPEAAEDEPAYSFGRDDEAEVFEWPLGERTARFAVTTPSHGRPADIRLELSTRTIDPAAEADERAVIGFGPGSNSHGGQSTDFNWTNALRVSASEALGRCAAAVEEALAAGAQKDPRSNAIWSAAAAYSAEIARRVRSPSLAGELVGPLCLDGFGAAETSDPPERGSMAARWIVAETATFAIFLTRKGRVTLSITARTIARDQSLTIRIDGDTVSDRDIEDGGWETPLTVMIEADLDWGPHEVEIVAPAFEREQGGDFRRLHLMIERCYVTWIEHDERHESEEELFGWAPPIWRAAPGAAPEPDQD